MYTILLQNHDFLKSFHIVYGGTRVHFLNTFRDYVSHLDTARQGEWYNNLLVGLNHGNTGHYFGYILDLIGDDVFDRTGLHVNEEA